jgi:hypothetical protein
VEAKGTAACEGPLEVGRSPGWPAAWDRAKGGFPDFDPNKLTWAFRREAAIGPAGDLR